MGDRISVIVPVYGVAEQLPRCLRSILAQSWKELEIIAVDDGSPDASYAILKEFAEKNPRLRVLRQENRGVTAARLRGVAAATGDWIGFVDGDDEIEPDMYERLLKNAEKYGADISHCGFRMCFPEGRTHFFHNTGAVKVFDRLDGLRELLSGEKIEPALCNKLFRRELFRGWEADGDIRINEDLLMNFHLFSNARVSVFEDWCPYHYIVRPGSASRQSLSSHRIFDPILVKERILEGIPRELETDARRAWLNTCVSTCNTLALATGDYRQELKTVRQKIRRQRGLIPLLTWKRRWMAMLLLHAPVLYPPVCRLYARFFGQDPYA